MSVKTCRACERLLEDESVFPCHRCQGLYCKECYRDSHIHVLATDYTGAFEALATAGVSELSGVA